MDEIKIRPDKISVGGNIKRIRTARHIRAYDLIRDLQLEGFNINKQRYYKLEHTKFSPSCARQTRLMTSRKKDSKCFLII